MTIDLGFVHNYGVSTRFYPGKERPAGTDDKTGEPITRQKTFSLSDDDMTLDDAINAANSARTSATNPDLITRCILEEAELLIIRGDTVKRDRASAYEMLNPATGLAAATMDAAQGAVGQALVGLANMTLQQINDGESPLVPLNEAIGYCERARTIFRDRVPANRKPYYHTALSYIIEAKLRVIRNKTALTKAEESKPDKAKLALLATLDTEEYIGKLLSQAVIEWTNVKAAASRNPYFTDPNLMTGSRNQEYYLGDEGKKIMGSVEKGLVFLKAWSKLELAKLTIQKGKPTQAGEKAFIAELEASILLCQEAQKILIGLKKTEDYVNHDAIQTEASLLARHARLVKNRSEMEHARDMFAKMMTVAGKDRDGNDVFTCPYNDIRALAVANRYSLDIELGEFNWDTVDTVLETYFDPSAGKKNIKYPFDVNTFPYMFILNLEAQLRNMAQRKVVVIPGCEKGCISVGESKVSDSQLSAIRSERVIATIDNINGLKAETKTEYKARSTYEHAFSTALTARTKSSSADKTTCFEAANKELGSILTTVLGEAPATVLDPKADTKMEISFYTALWTEEAGNLEQIVWLTYQGQKVKKPNNKDPFTDAKKKYNEALKLCARSNSPYDVRERKMYIQLALKKIELLGNQPIEFTLDAAGTKTAFTNLEDYIKFIDEKITEANGMPAEGSFTDRNKEKLINNLKRIKFEALCLKMFFINKQKEENLTGLLKKTKDKTISDLFVEAKKIADEILPKLDDIYYTVLNLFGISSVCLRIIPDIPVDTIVTCYQEYVLKRDLEVTYDMLDALASASTKKKYENLMATVKAELAKLIKANKDKKTDDAYIICAKAYTLLARIYAWSFSDSDPATYGHLLTVKKKEDGTTTRSGAIPYYDAAIAKLKLIKGEKEKMYENGASLVALMEERALYQFSFTNATLPNVSDDVERIAGYRQIAKDINDLLATNTDVEGLSADTRQKVQDQDKYAKIRARLTLISMYTSLAEPILRHTATNDDVVAICGQLVTDNNELFKLAEMQLSAVLAEIGTSTDPLLEAMEIDKLSIELRMAENYGTLYLRTSGPISVIAVDAILLKARIAEVEAKHKDVKYEEEKNGLKITLANVDRAKSKLVKRGQVYKKNMEDHMTNAESATGTSTLRKAKALLARARFTQWTAGNFDKPLSVMTKDELAAILGEGLKKAEKLYEKAKKADPRVMDNRAKLDYASLFVTMTIASAGIEDRTSDVMAIIQEGNDPTKWVTSNPGPVGARACIMIANLKLSKSDAKESDIKEALVYVRRAICKLIGIAESNSTEAIIGEVEKKNPIMGAQLIEALCYLGVIEGRLFTLLVGPDRKKNFTNMRDNIMTKIVIRVDEPYQAMELLDDGTLMARHTELMHYSDHINKSYWDALSGAERAALKIDNPTLYAIIQKSLKCPSKFARDLEIINKKFDKIKKAGE